MPDPAAEPPAREPDTHELDARVAAVRRFNRFYTRRIGLLHKGYLKSALSLAEIRVLYEIAHRDGATASEIGRDLELDAGYLSRMLSALAGRGLIRRTPSRADARQSHLALTERGTRTFLPLERRSHQEIAALLAGLSDADQARTVAAMATIEALLAPAADRKAADPSPDLPPAPSPAPSPAPPPYSLRPHRPGDIGWVVSRHGSLYAAEYGWNIVIEAYVAEVVAAFLKNFDAAGERCWIAEIDGEAVGSVFLTRESAALARLRLLIVDPRARGLGIGARLVDECIRFAGACGYRRITLWTHSILVAARAIYARAGFRLVDSAPHATFGPTLVGETWQRDL